MAGWTEKQSDMAGWTEEYKAEGDMSSVQCEVWWKQLQSEVWWRQLQSEDEICCQRMKAQETV